MSVSARRCPCAPCFRAASHLFLTKPYVADRICICIFQIRKMRFTRLDTLPKVTEVNRDTLIFYFLICILGLKSVHRIAFRFLPPLQALWEDSSIISSFFGRMKNDPWGFLLVKQNSNFCCNPELICS